jgi:hypothetical protein
MPSRTTQSVTVTFTNQPPIKPLRMTATRVPIVYPG